MPVCFICFNISLSLFSTVKITFYLFDLFQNVWKC
uniref:Uncharacterized protein n=1 Tax=Anguilla anguilla TaxID=7936 RepID=A0A0E9R4Q7_ANGAN